jgi:cobalt-zinc-cadmium efflux system protein
MAPHDHSAHGQAHGPHRHGADDPHDHHAHVDGGALRAFRWSTVLNVGLVAAQLAAGAWLGSVALLADAVHNASDVLGLLLAWGAARLATRRPTRQHTYGLARSTILAALLNAALLLFACGALAWESLGRLGEPHPVPGLAVMAVALFAFAVNTGSAALFWRGRRGDANQRGAFLHLAADAGVSLGVVVAGALIWLTGWTWIDPATGLLIAAVVLWSGWGLLRESLDLALDAVPRGIEIDAVEAALRGVAGVRAVHDLHVWPLSTTVVALTAHVEHDGAHDTDALLHAIQQLLAARFGIRHATIQFELQGCGQAC